MVELTSRSLDLCAVCSRPVLDRFMKLSKSVNGAKKRSTSCGHEGNTLGEGGGESSRDHSPDEGSE